MFPLQQGAMTQRATSIVKRALTLTHFSRRNFPRRNRSNSESSTVSDRGEL